MGRNKLWHEDMVARFAEGTFSQIDRLSENDETRTDFVRTAVSNEIENRKEKKRAARAARSSSVSRANAE